MALIKHRPELQLKMPAQLHAGQSFTAEVRVVARQPVPIEGCDCRLDGEETSAVGAGSTRRTIRRPLVALAAELCGKRELPAGRTSFGVRFDLPIDTPPSYSGKSIKVSYELTVRVSIPWWPDAEQRFWVEVAPAPRNRQGKPRLYSTNPDGPVGEEPHLECSIASDEVAAGEVIRGSVALFNMAANRYREVRLSLVGWEERRDLRGNNLGSHDAHRFVLRQPLERVTEAEAVPFNLRVPEDVPPSYQSELSELRWSLDVRAVRSWASDVNLPIPLTVVPKKDKEHPAVSVDAPPSIGSARIHRIWTEVAREFDLSFDGETIDFECPGVSAKLKREHRGSAGLFLVAELSYPNLRLDLDGGLVSGFRRMFGGSIELGHSVWDRHHYLSGRDEQQIRTFVKRLFKTEVPARLADMDDEHLVLEHQDAGQQAEVLRQFVRSAVAVAGSFAPARAAIPPPTIMRNALEAWLELARQLHGDLETARMAIAGRYEGMDAWVHTQWTTTGEAIRTLVTLDSGATFADGVSFHFAADDPPEQVAEKLVRVPAGARALVAELRQQGSALLVQDKNLSVALPAPLHHPVKPVFDVLDRLSALAQNLKARQGPYR